MKNFLIPSLIFLSAAVTCLGQAPKRPAVGDKAPEIKAQDQDGKQWQVPNPAEKKVTVLYFYPKDDTPGCTREACGFRDRIGDLKKQNVNVLGVSFDSAESHQKFISKYNLNFPLLVDSDGKIADAYGVRIPGQKMARRVSFLITPDGTIAHVTDSPDADVHLRETESAISKIKSSAT